MLYRLSIVREKVSDETPEPLTDPEKTVRFLKEHCFHEEDLWREQCYAVLLDSQLVPHGTLLVSLGTLTHTPFDLQTVFYTMLETLTSRVIIAHNHPNGNPTPSQSDITQTENFKKGLDLLGMRLIDHVILGEGRAFSFSKEREFKF